MLKKKLGIELIESERCYQYHYCYKIPSTLIIPEGCEKIGIRAFWGSRVKRVVIPRSVKRIEDNAFCGCDRLEGVEILDGVEEIGDHAFYGCFRATIILKKPVSEIEFIGYAVFWGCRDVKEETRD